jgi:hypothetical protein
MSVEVKGQHGEVVPVGIEDAVDTSLEEKAGTMLDRMDM